ncbi:unnamed protein product [Brachionus calyciflorus]|uniref:Uncharacterized protein n=1 Tax=Brachionus calyciflorus TaxID=104777 RepID=A0A813M721_9BILA|nr:unnamed protein product [Brachionus calyciflorus]
MRLEFRSYRYINHDCKCFQNNYITLEKNNEFKYIVKIDQKTYEINAKKTNFTCDLYKSLKRGPKQKIVSFSLYGNNELYYNYITNLTSLIKKFYPDHVMRIYHDHSIDVSFKCDLECANSHVEFCNIEKMSLNLNDYNKVLNLSYIHAMMWRFLPLGDSFVDLFMSRDTDSLVLQREVDAVQEWIKSENIAHIMRDNPAHTTEILGGMWGFKSALDRTKSNDVFNLIIDRNLTIAYNPGGISKKGYDQFFLTDHVYNRIKTTATIHDSFLCTRYPNTKAFPTKRVGNCFVGGVGWCDPNRNFTICPRECRPGDHQDWESC